ncbi:hypothetical protein OROMI_000915 [Orobanche minor]
MFFVEEIGSNKHMVLEVPNSNRFENQEPTELEHENEFEMMDPKHVAAATATGNFRCRTTSWWIQSMLLLLLLLFPLQNHKLVDPKHVAAATATVSAAEPQVDEANVDNQNTTKKLSKNVPKRKQSSNSKPPKNSKKKPTTRRT